jgi:hypothetical protein
VGTGTLVIAVVTEDERSDAAIGLAARRGLEDRARVVLYDVQAAPSFLESPLPTEWSAQGDDDALPPMLTPEALRSAGQGALARKVQALADAGIDAYGWLPGGPGVQELADYAEGTGADEIIATAGIDPGPSDVEAATAARVTTAPT